MKNLFVRILIIICAVACSFATNSCTSVEAKKVKTHRAVKQKKQSKVGAASQVIKSDKPLVLSNDDKLCVDRANELAFTLLKKQSSSEPFKSFTFSPLSVSYALAMASNGASGATLKEIEALTGPSAAANSFYSRYVAHFTPSVVMSNYLAMNNRFIINPEYIKAITGVYNAQVSNLDFGTSKATQQLNDWIKQQSGGEFDNIVKETHPNEIIYLINYLKFKALWANPLTRILLLTVSSPTMMAPPLLCRRCSAISVNFTTRIIPARQFQ